MATKKSATKSRKTAKKKATAKDLSDARKIEANTSGTRLLNLYKKRLVKRVEDIRSDGKVWAYELL